MVTMVILIALACLTTAVFGYVILSAAASDDPAGHLAYVRGLVGFVMAMAVLVVGGLLGSGVFGYYGAFGLEQQSATRAGRWLTVLAAQVGAGAINELLSYADGFVIFARPASDMFDACVDIANDKDVLASRERFDRAIDEMNDIRTKFGR